MARDEARARVRGPRRFHRSGGRPPDDDDNQGGGHGDEGPIWPPPNGPSAHGRRVEWPYWFLLLTPWAMLTAGFVLSHFGVCVMCLPANVPLPAGP